MRYFKLLVLSFLVTVGIIKSNDSKAKTPTNLHQAERGGSPGSNPCFET